VGGRDAGGARRAGALGLDQDRVTATLIVGVGFEDLLQGHLAVQLCTTNLENLVRRARFSNPFSGIGFCWGLTRLQPASLPPRPAPRGSPRPAPGPAPSPDIDASSGPS